jgi:hypothetical protein
LGLLGFLAAKKRIVAITLAFALVGWHFIFTAAKMDQ